MLVTTIEEFREIAGVLKTSMAIAWDFETTSLHHKTMEVLGVSFCADNLKPVYIQLEAIPKVGAFNIMHSIFKLDATFIAHNYVFDGKILHHFYKAYPEKVFDTMVAAWYLDENRESFGLKQLAKQILKLDMTKYKDVDKDDIEAFAKYGAMDAYATYELYKIFSGELAANPKANALFQELEMQFLEVLIDITLSGFLMDQEYLVNMASSLRVNRDILKEKLEKDLGGININSTQQLCKALYGIEVSRKGGKLTMTKLDGGFVQPKLQTKSGAPATSDAALEKLDHPIIDRLREYRGVEKLLTTYAEGYQRFIVDGKIYPNFLPTGTVTGRLSCVNPNMMNLPRSATEGWFIRDAFICPEGYDLIVADESQLELRLLAHFSKDAALMEAFLSEGDVHTRTASQIFRKPMDAITKEERQSSKTINFGIMYGMGPQKLADSLKITESQAKFLLQQYFETYEGVHEWFNTVETYAKRNGYVKTIIGRTRSLPDIWSRDRALYSRARRQAVNSVIQGSAADILKVAMVKIRQELKDRGLDATILSQIHDELVVQSLCSQSEEVAEVIKTYMEHPFSKELAVPLIVEPKIVKRWSDGK